MLRNPSVRRCNGWRDNSSAESRFTIPVWVPRTPGTLSAVTTTFGRGRTELSGTVGVCATTGEAAASRRMHLQLTACLLRMLPSTLQTGIDRWLHPDF